MRSLLPREKIHLSFTTCCCCHPSGTFFFPPLLQLDKQGYLSGARNCFGAEVCIAMLCIIFKSAGDERHLRFLE